MRFLPLSLVIAGGIVLDLWDVPLLGIQALRLDYGLMVLFFLACYVWNTVPFLMVLALGLLFDLVIGLPFGLSVLLFLSIAWIVDAQRAYLRSQSFLVLWFVFGILCVVAAFYEWAVFSLLQGHFVFSWIPLFQKFLTILFFPLGFLALYHSWSLAGYKKY
jgi:rod shape-determining protein MreD